MPSRTVLRSRATPRPAPAWFRRYQVQIVRLVTALALLATALFAGWGIRQWYLQAKKDTLERYLAPAKERFSTQFNARWFSVLPIPSFSDGGEPATRAFLKAEPAVEALVSRNDGILWIRNGDHLVRTQEPPLKDFYLSLAKRIQELGADFLSPEGGRDPDFGWILRTAVSTNEYVVIKRVTPGGVELDLELEHIIGPELDVRVNLHHLEPEAKQGRLPMSDKWTAFQLPDSAVKSETWVVSYWNRNHTLGWVWSVIPGPGLRRTMWFFLLGRMALFLVPILLLGSLLLVILRMRQVMNRQDELSKDRLASLTHGLKTPLAVIKAWCDATRHGQLDKDRADETLIRIGEQVDQLTMIIENGLRTLHSQVPSSSGEPVTFEWLEETGAEFESICVESGRTFHTRFQGEGARTNRVSLQQVLQTFLENALIHGQGNITFSSYRKGSRLLLTVEDEGPGLKPHQLKELGLPFQRFRRRAAEGFEAPGVGVGVSIAIQVAKKEGWGLSFQSDLHSGLLVALELRD